jgi:hypothetical protein
MMTIYGRSVGDKCPAGTDTPLQIPNSVTAVTNIDTWLFGMVINNTTGAAITLTLTNAAGTELMSALSFPANSYTTIEHWKNPPLFAGGFKWTASATGLICQLSVGVLR